MTRRRAPYKCLTTYSWHAPEDDEHSIDEAPLEKLLEQAKADGYVREYDTGRGRGLWLSTAPGKQARALKRAIEKIVPAHWLRGDRQG